MPVQLTPAAARAVLRLATLADQPVAVATPSYVDLIEVTIDDRMLWVSSTGNVYRGAADEDELATRKRRGQILYRGNFVPVESDDDLRAVLP